MNINKIKKLKDNKYKITIDNDDYITYDNVILDNELLYKKSIDKDTFKKIIDDTRFYEIYNKTVKYILKKLRSKKEIINYLNKNELKEEEIKKIIKKLESINLINDEKFTKAYINDQIYLSKNGINKIRQNLLNQNIPSNIIENELSKIDNSVIDARLEKLVLKRIKSNKKYSNNELKIKILNEAILLGYDKEKALSIIENNIIEDSNIIEKEYTKIYNKLSLKYSGNELKNKIKQKLYSRGFAIEEINNVIQKKAED